MSVSKNWCFTVNNFSDDLVSNLKKDDRIRRGIFGDEVGESGTRHLQGYFEFFSALRFNAVKNLLPRAHICAAKGSSFDNYKYCSKDGKFQTMGEWETVIKNGNKSKQNNEIQMSDLIEQLATNGKSDLKNSGLYIRHKNSIDQRVSELREERIAEKRREQLLGSKLSSWQFDIMVRLSVQDDRSILWICDYEGGKGKTFLSNVLQFCFGYVVLDGVSKTSDIAMIMRSKQYKGVCFDVTRSDASHFSYPTLENVKNGRLVTGKYQGAICLLKQLPVIVFANFHPLEEKLSADRWDIVTLDFEGPNETPWIDLRDCPQEESGPAH